MDTGKDSVSEWEEQQSIGEPSRPQRLSQLFTQVARDVDKLVRVRWSLVKAEIAAAGPALAAAAYLWYAAHILLTAAVTLVLFGLADYVGAATGSFRSGAILLGALTLAGALVLAWLARKRGKDCANIPRESADSNVHELGRHKNYRTASMGAGELS